MPSENVRKAFGILLTLRIPCTLCSANIMNCWKLPYVPEILVLLPKVFSKWATNISTIPKMIAFKYLTCYLWTTFSYTPDFFFFSLLSKLIYASKGWLPKMEILEKMVDGWKFWAIVGKSSISNFGRVPNTSPITGFYFRVQSSRFSTHRNGMLEMK